MPQKGRFSLADIDKPAADPSGGTGRFKLTDIDKPTTEPVAQPASTDMRSWQQVAGDQAANVVKGAASLITGIPGTLQALHHGFTNPMDPANLEFVKGAARSITSPFTTSIRGLGALGSPDKFQAPSQEEFEQAAQGAGALAASVVAKPIAGKIRSAITSRIFSPPGGKMTFNQPVTTSATPGVTSISKALGGEVSAEEMGRLNNSLEISLPDLFQTEREWLKRRIGGTIPERLTNTVSTHEDALQVARETKQRIFEQDLKPFVQDSKTQMDLQPVKTKMKADLHKTAMTDAERMSAENEINQEIPDTAPLSDVERLRQQYRAEADALQSKNAVDRATSEKTVSGARLATKYNNLADAMYDKIKATSGYNVSPAMKRYGAVKDVHSALLDKPIDPTFVESVSGTYMAGERNIKGQLIKGLTKGYTSPDNMIRRGFNSAREVHGNTSPRGNAPIANVMGQVEPKRLQNIPGQRPQPEPQDLIPQGPGVLERPPITGQGSVVARPQYSGTPAELADLTAQGQALWKSGAPAPPPPGQLPLFEKGPRTMFPPPGVKQTPFSMPPTIGPSLSDIKYSSPTMNPNRQISTGLQELPAGTEVPQIQADPRLPSRYSGIQPYPQAGPGYMGPINTGTAGPIPQIGEQTAMPLSRSQRMRIRKRQ